LLHHAQGLGDDFVGDGVVDFPVAADCVVHATARVGWDEKEICGLWIRCAAWVVQKKAVQMNLHRKHAFIRRICAINTFGVLKVCGSGGHGVNVHARQLLHG
jgi:hypothetical protein